MQQVWRFLPIIVGLILGWMIFNPPAFLESLGLLKYAVMLALVFLLLVAFVAWNIHSTLPETVSMAPELGAGLGSEGSSFARQLEGLGFKQISDTTLRVGLAPPALMIPYIHESERMYATVFQTTTIPPKASFDFVSVFQGITGGLTTSREEGGGAMPAPPGTLRQILPGQSLQALFEEHRNAIKFIKTRGIECRSISRSDFERDFRTSFSQMRHTYLKNPLVFTLITLWRAATKTTPNLGALSSQSGLQEQLRQLSLGRTGF